MATQVKYKVNGNFEFFNEGFSKYQIALQPFQEHKIVSSILPDMIEDSSEGTKIGDLADEKLVQFHSENNGASLISLLKNVLDITARALDQYPAQEKAEFLFFIYRNLFVEQLKMEESFSEESNKLKTRFSIFKAKDIEISLHLMLINRIKKYHALPVEEALKQVLLTQQIDIRSYPDRHPNIGLLELNFAQLKC